MRIRIGFAGTIIATGLLPVSGGVARAQLTEVAAQAPLVTWSVSAKTSADGATMRQGGTLIITWQSTGAPAGSAVALLPEKERTGHVFDPIAAALPASGSYTWRVPIFVPAPIACAPDRTGACLGSMNPDTTYRMLVRLYTPPQADLTGRRTAVPAILATAASGVFAMLPAQGR